jgi:hypothetical protein
MLCHTCILREWRVVQLCPHNSTQRMPLVAGSTAPWLASQSQKRSHSSSCSLASSTVCVPRRLLQRAPASNYDPQPTHV